MQKKFISNLVLIVLLNLLVKPLAIFGIDASVQNRVGAEEYGLYFTLLNLSFLFNIVMDLGINNYTTKNIAQYPHIVSQYIGKIFSFRLILFGLYAIVTMTIAVGIGYREEQLYMIAVLIFNQWLVTFIAYFRSHFGGLHLFKTDALISVLDRLLLIILCGGVLFFTTAGKSFQIEWFIWMQTACYLITLIIAFGLLVKEIGVPSFKFNWVFSLAILKKSYPYALLILLMMIYTRTDSIMLERIHPNGSYEAGIYAQGFRLLDAFFMFGMIFANLLLPIFSKLIKENKTGVLVMLNTSRNLLVGGSIFVAFVCVQNAEFLLGLIYKHDVVASSKPFQLLMWSFIGMCISLIYGTLLTANGNLRFLNQLSIFGIILNIVFNTLLIPEYGATGSAFATLVTQGITSIAQFIYCHKHFAFAFTVKQFINYFAFTAVFIVLPFLVTEQKYLLPFQLVFGVLGMFIFKLIDLKGLKKAFAEKI